MARPRRWSPEDLYVDQGGVAVMPALAQGLFGPLAGPRDNPNYTPGSTTEMPYQKAGFFRRLLGDTSNARNDLYKQRAAQVALAEQAENKLMDREWAEKKAMFEASQEAAAREQEARIALEVNKMQAQARLAQQIAQQEAMQAQLGREFTLQRDTTQGAQELERQRQGIVMPAMLKMGYSPDDYSDPLMRNMAAQRIGKQNEEEFRRAGLISMRPGEAMFDPTSPVGVYNDPAGSPLQKIPPGPKSAPNPFFKVPVAEAPQKFVDDTEEPNPLTPEGIVQLANQAGLQIRPTVRPAPQAGVQPMQQSAPRSVEEDINAALARRSLIGNFFDAMNEDPARRWRRLSQQATSGVY